MNSLMSYGSDDDSNESGDQKFPEMPGRHAQSGAKNYRRPAAHEDNYEEVGMDMSEDSGDSNGPPTKNREEPRQNPNRQASHSFGKRSEAPPTSGYNSSYQHSDRKSGSNSPKYKKEDRRPGRPEDSNREDRYRGSEDSNREDRYRVEDKNRRRNERGSRDSRDDDGSKDKGIREDDKGRDRYRDDRGDRRYGRDRRDRDRRRSRSRDRRRSRSPRRSTSPRRTSKSPRRSRSGSRDKGSKPYLSRREKADKRMDRLDKLGIQFKPDNYPPSAIQEAETRSSNNGNRFFMPGITGRFREQIEKRKQLWQKAKEQDTVAGAGPSASSTVTDAPAGGSKATKVYEATTFSDDKTSNKFKRLMGIKGTDTESLPVKATDVLKKQQEMFTSMEAQYEVARTATHTMRGVGLGFGSFQR